MEYKFEIKQNLGDVYYEVIAPFDSKVLESFSAFYINPTDIQKILEGIENSRDKEWNERYVWSSEDVLVYSFKEGVALYDELARRADPQAYEGKAQDLDLTHDEFIQFLEDFKEFVADNQ